MPAQTRSDQPVQRGRSLDAPSVAAPRWLAAITDPVVLTCVVVTGFAALGGFVGADARWLAALGRDVTRAGSIPTGVPFAAAPTAHWHNAVVLAELSFYGLHSLLGERGLMLAQLVAVAVAVIVLMQDARASGASPKSAGVAVLVAAIGAFSVLVIARVQLFSLVLFPVLMALLRSEARKPSRRIWLAVPLIVLWTNLHGAVLIGVGITLVYLALSRFREDRWTSIAVGVGVLVALCMTPAGLASVSYYQGLLTNEAAARGTELWAPFSLTAPLDLVLLISAIVLALQLRRCRPKLWELVVLVGLAGATIQASRSGVWLLFFLAVSAARGLRSPRWWDWIMPPLAALASIGLVAGIVRGPLVNGAGSAVIARSIAMARGTPILADDAIGEQVALAGGRIWVGDPIDAFSKADQSTYLDWVEGRSSGLRALGPDVHVVLTARGSGAQRLMSRDPAFKQVASDQRSEIYARVGGQ